MRYSHISDCKQRGTAYSFISGKPIKHEGGPMADGEGHWYDGIVAAYHNVMNAFGNAGAPNNDALIGQTTRNKALTNEAYQAATGSNEKISTGLAETINLDPHAQRTAGEAVSNGIMATVFGTIRNAENAQKQHVGTTQPDGTEQQR